MKKASYFIVLISFSLLTSCAVHNVPKEVSPNVRIEPNTFKAFVDLNGNFYPDKWEQTIGPYKKKSSLYLTAENEGKLNSLSEFETKMLLEFEKVIKNKKRVFIFIHGFNKLEDKSKISYNNLRSKIDLCTDTDEVIEFNWDGLSSLNPFGIGKMWFNAAGYSQMAGEFGLRKILNVIHGKKIIIISHSRGASVVLSALSNPPYDPKFLKETKELKVPIGNPIPLLENDNSITTIMLAPAIGEIDFAEENDINRNRKFSSQLKSIHITVNNNDKVLNKFIGLSRHLNATDLGHNLSVYNKLLPTYVYMTYDDFTGQDSHDFNKYLDNPKFAVMLGKYLY